MRGGWLWFPWPPRIFLANASAPGLTSEQLPKFSGYWHESFIHLIWSPFSHGLLEKSGPR